MPCRVPASVATAPSQQQMGPNTAAMFMNVPLAKRVNHLIEWSGSGILLDMASAALSLLTVFTYMVCLCLLARVLLCTSMCWGTGRPVGDYLHAAPIRLAVCAADRDWLHRV
jgi:hypothetical protein